MKHSDSLLSPLLIFLLAIVARCPAVELVREGRAVATVVAAPSQESAAKKGKAREVEGDEALAVRTLVEWIEKITGARLPVAAAAAEGAPAIFVGKAAIEAGLQLGDIASPTREGLRIVADERRVLLGGQSEAATLKAVCRFLEELGCRYFMDGPLGEVHPRSPTLRVGRLSIAEKPGLLMRNPKGPSWNARLWKAWNGAGGEAMQHGHSWERYVGREMFAQHPEWFALGADGERKAGGWLCTSNPELRAYFATRVVATIEGGLRHPSLSPTDGNGYCQCATCKAQDDPQSREPSNGNVAMSNRYVDFFDDIARRVAVAQPDSILSFYCYADYTQPPTVARRLAPNLCAVIAPIRYCRLHEIGHAGCPSREQQRAMIDGWAAVASRLGYYNYLYNLADGTLPFFKFTACKKEFPYLQAKGLSLMTIEVLSNWHIYGPQIYLSLRLAYDPGADAEALMEDYWQKFYGPRAALLMREYWMGLDAALGRLTSHAGSFYGLAQIYTPDFLRQCAELLAKAADAARGDAVFAERVALHAGGFESAVQYRRIGDAMSRGDFASAKSDYEQMVARLHDFAAKGWANREYDTAYLRRFLSQTVLRGAEVTAPPNKLLQVLPDRWRFAFDEDDRGLERRQHAADFDDTRWPQVATHTATLDAQGYDKNTILWYRSPFQAPARHGRLVLFFGEINGVAEVHVNGRKIEIVPYPPPPDAAGKPAKAPARLTRTPFEVDITDAVHPGENLVAVRVDHTRITDLALGGLLRPVLLVEKK